MLVMIGLIASDLSQGGSIFSCLGYSQDSAQLPVTLAATLKQCRDTDSQAASLLNARDSAAAACVACLEVYNL